MEIIISFGQTHEHKVQGKVLDKDCLARIECNSYEQGIERALHLFKNKFANYYRLKDLTKEHLDLYPRGIINIS